ncbi:MAG: glycosyltransferase, partial [Sulfitobacter sp.]|nr:glycosyltransferase [Sulfitobacter sp.]
PEGLAFFNKTPSIDYNAWWFCTIPTDVIRSIGLPPRLFIRGDDIEYGSRMAAAGVKTIPLPGCAVWHESFAYKRSDWLLYYDIRNRLFLAILHPDNVAPPDSLYLLGHCMSILFKHQYRSVETLLKAIADAVEEPRVTFAASETARHNALMSWLNDIPAPKVYSTMEMPECEQGAMVPLNPSVSAMIRMCVKGFINLHLSRLRPRRKPLRFQSMPEATAVGSRDYLACRNPEGTEFTLYQSSLFELWRLLFKTLHVCLQHKLRYKKMTTTYGAQLETLRSKEMWRKAFGIDQS